MNVTCTCGTTFEARSPRARYCSDRCRKRAQRGGDVVELPAAKASSEPLSTGGVYEATMRELTEAGRQDTAVGRTCLQLALRLDNPGVDTGSAMATVAARLDDLLGKATKGAGASRPGQLQDELAERRARHA